MSARHVTERAALPRPGCARPAGCVARLPSQAVAVWPVWRLGAGRQPCVPTLRPAAAPEPRHRLSWYCEAPGCTRVDLHARCGLGSDVTAAPPRCPEARAGGAQQITPTAPPPPHLPPRMLPVASKYSQRPRGAVGRWWWPSLAHASRVSLGGRHGRPRACVAVSMQAARDAQSRLTLETEATYVSCTSPSGPGSVCPSTTRGSSTSHTRTARPESVDFGSWRRGAVAFSSEACRPTQPQWRLSAVPIGLGRRVRRLSSRLVGVFSFSDVSRRCDCRNEAKCAVGGTSSSPSGATRAAQVGNRAIYRSPPRTR